MPTTRSTAAAETTDDSVYSQGAQRLAKALRKAGTACSKAALLDMLLYHFSDACFSYVQALSQPTPDWHLIEFGPACPADLFQHYDAINQAPRLVEALAFALEQLDFSHAHPDQVQCAGDALELLRNGGVVMRVRPVPYEPVNELGRKRATTALKGLRRFGFTAALARLRKLPGLENLQPPSYVRLPDTPRSGPLNITAAELANQLRVGLAELQIRISQSEALELTAVTFGAPSWHQTVSLEKQLTTPLLPPAHITHFVAGVEQSFHCYRAPADAVWAFTQRAKARFPGEPVIYYGPYHDGVPTLSIGEMDSTHAHTTCHRPSLAFPNDRYVELAQQLLASPDGLEAALTQELALNASPDAQLLRSLTRGGISGDKVLRLKDWLFTIQTGNQESTLFAEHLDSARQLLSRSIVALYKAELRLSDKGVAELWEDYGRTRAAEFPELTTSEVAVLAKFSGLRCQALPRRTLH